MALIEAPWSAGAAGAAHAIAWALAAPLSVALAALVQPFVETSELYLEPLSPLAGAAAHQI